MPAHESKSTLEQILLVLDKHRVEYLVIGGQAELIFGSPRVTYAFDFCYRRTPANYEALALALRELGVWLRGAPRDLPLRIDARTIELGEAFTFSSDLADIDFLGYVEPLGPFEQLAPRAEHYSVGACDVRTISLEDLIAVKQHINRPKDRESLMQLLAIRRLRQERPSTPNNAPPHPH